ncbi:hypothetical protein HIV01_015765 [Lysobacter arenosi]|uniref:Uncharacterized protein n=1 Tax=Lysobacter arenosi TaxID=2795387 RepID=A0ABX7R927_9GAMM|nr:hypothetical protein [Lysobacter arenosi]QSX74615.1 hypothetical protein HIV01_015765 [Lysobacter arenosi]
MNEDPLKATRDEAFRMLGRNFVLFQHLEMALKLLTTISDLEGSNQDQLEACLEARRASLAKQSLGQLIGRYRETVFGEGDSTEPAESPATIRVQFRIQGPEYQAWKTAQLAALVNERNQLAHHLLEGFNLRTSEGIQDLKDLLEPQADRIRTEILQAKAILAIWPKAHQLFMDELTAQLDEDP